MSARPCPAVPGQAGPPGYPHEPGRPVQIFGASLALSRSPATPSSLSRRLDERRLSLRRPGSAPPRRVSHHPAVVPSQPGRPRTFGVPSPSSDNPVTLSRHPVTLPLSLLCPDGRRAPLRCPGGAHGHAQPSRGHSGPPGCCHEPGLLQPPQTPTLRS